SIVIPLMLGLMVILGNAAAAQKQFDPNFNRRQRMDLVFPDEPNYVLQPMPMQSVRDLSWVYSDPPLLPDIVKLHDIIKIIVDEKSEVTLRSGFNRQRRASLVTGLNEFIRFGERNRLANAALNSPTIDVEANGRMQTTGRVTDQEGIRYRIAATVVNVLPNGNLVLEARKSIRLDGDLWQLSLTGVISSRSIRAGAGKDWSALSEDIANLSIEKRRAGKVYNSTRRRWGLKLYDLLWPF
ncbi:MAG: flagellar basal body L-ring protein FlgH, partial [Planctomycetaceae bacterium]